MSETGELKFTTSLGGTRIIRIPNPNASINQMALTNAANMFVAANPFDETIGQLVDLVHAQRVSVSSIQLIP